MFKMSSLHSRSIFRDRKSCPGVKISLGKIPVKARLLRGGYSCKKGGNLNAKVASLP